MKLTKCENKHFYDADKYDACPHCGSNTPPVTPHHPAPKPTEQPSSITVVTLPDESNVTDSAPLVTPKFHEPASVMPQHIPDTVPMSQQNLEPTPVLQQISEAVPDNSLQAQVNAVNSHSMVGTNSTDSTKTTNNTPDAPRINPQTEDVKTVAMYGFTETEPVVGWLVCIKGEYIGESFNLKTGQNFIGRSMNMDVPLAKDTTISRNKHTVIIYDPQNRVFFVQPGESSGLTYHNGQLLLSHLPLNIYDKIKAGNSEFVFFPCCGKKFTWEDYI